ncbi:dynein light chain Tctex-type 1-like [Hippocampus zosterae]|uniref:dynein light chain Tctex-type 1-like n=1 Tax=Hippocampus zosterae TaxID=109293 RepID=UPI00223D9EB3|nr:dynein light chain Tctex-type 1-like [Hippocampus zosterae]
MDDNQNQEELLYTSDEVERLILESIEQVLVGKSYSEADVPKWINALCEDIMKKLIESQKPYKYMINCLIQQKTGQGLIAASSSFWDSASDLGVTVMWPKDKQIKGDQTKASIQCMVTVYTLSLI